MDDFGVEEEKKRTRKALVWVVQGSKNATELVANAQSFLWVAPPFPVCTGHPRAVAPPP